MPLIPQDGFQGVHFGTLRVVDDASWPLAVRNTGRYEVAFRFAIASQAVLDLVTISPMEGLLAPAKEVAVTVREIS
jgi:hydrocephalus-inducing protein